MFEQQNSMGIMCTPQEDHSLRGTLTQVASSWQKKPSSVGIPGCVFCFTILQTVYACLRIASILHQQTLTLSRFLWFQAVRPTSQHAERYGAQSTANGWSKKLVYACMYVGTTLYAWSHRRVLCVHTQTHTHTMLDQSNACADFQGGYVHAAAQFTICVSMRAHMCLKKCCDMLCKIWWSLTTYII